MEWLSIKQTSELSNRSQSTIKRHLKEHGLPVDQLKNNQKTDGKLLYKKEPANRGFKWFIEKGSALVFYDESINETIKPVQQSTDGNLIESLNNQIELLKNELEQKNKQIEKLHILLSDATKHQKQIEYQKDQTQGIFSKVLIKFGL